MKNKLKKPFIVAEQGPKVAELLQQDKTLRLLGPTIVSIVGKKIRSAVENTQMMDAFIAAICPLYADKPRQLNWVIKQYLTHKHNGKPIMAEDMSKVAMNLHYFESLKSSVVFKGETDLLKYKTYAEFEKTLEPYNQKKQQKETLAMQFRLTPQAKAEILSQSTILYQGNEGIVVIPHTPRASQYWGNNTKWCISSSNYAGQHFTSYNKISPVIIIIPKDMHDQKVALVGKSLYDEKDKEIQSLPPLHHSLFHIMLKNLSPKAQQGIARYIPMAIHTVDRQINTSSKYIPSLNKPYVRGVKAEINYLKANNWQKVRKPEYWRNPAFVLAAIAHYSWAFKYADPALSADRDFVLAAVIKYGSSVFNYAAPELRSDREFVLAIVAKKGKTLEATTPELRADREIVLAAVKENGKALKWASPKLNADLEVVLTAMVQNYEANEFVHQVTLKKLSKASVLIHKALSENIDLPFVVRSLDVWQPDDATLLQAQIKALQKIATTNDQVRLAKYARHFKECWGDAEKLFALDTQKIMHNFPETKSDTRKKVPARTQQLLLQAS